MIKITIEGERNTGKSAIAALVNQALADQNIPVELTGVNAGSSTLENTGVVAIVEKTIPKVQQGLQVYKVVRAIARLFKK